MALGLKSPRPSAGVQAALSVLWSSTMRHPSRVAVVTRVNSPARSSATIRQRTSATATSEPRGITSRSKIETCGGAEGSDGLEPSARRIVSSPLSRSPVAGRRDVAGVVGEQPYEGVQVSAVPGRHQPVHELADRALNLLHRDSGSCSVGGRLTDQSPESL